MDNKEKRMSPLEWAIMIALVLIGFAIALRACGDNVARKRLTNAYEGIIERREGSPTPFSTP